ncbi:DUF4760 domain-containing protein [Altererythrobacter sp. MTPC7]|uniref:DUF4760 domain-containing protein n=1 Tax=Altererythrobacter sp. MTPC7 TaxID=3056567 RepID=UPI0036F2C35B
MPPLVSITQSTAPSTPLGAVLIASVFASTIAVWGVVSSRIVARRRATMDHMAATNIDDDMLRAQKEFIRLANKAGGLAKWAEPSKESSKEAEAIRLVLNDFELISTSIQMGIMDYSLYYKFCHGTVIKYWTAAAPFVHALRQRTGSTTLYEEFQCLYDWVKDNKKPKGVWRKQLF